MLDIQSPQLTLDADLAEEGQIFGGPGQGSRSWNVEDFFRSLLPDTGSTMSLDRAIDRLGTLHADPYELVAAEVRRGSICVEFEATARPFPHREILVRRL